MTLRKLPTKISAGFGLSMIDRAVKESHAGRCSTLDLLKVRSYFEKNGELRCIYCNKDEAKRWDHLHPVSRGGDTVPGNLVPACGSCDDSKQDREVEEWIQGTSLKRPSSDQSNRIHNTIRRYRTQFPYKPRPFEEKLSPKERKAYLAFQSELSALRSHLQNAGLLKAKK